MKIKNILMSGVMAMSCLVASAQDAPKTEYVFNPHWYVQGQVGAQYSLVCENIKHFLHTNEFVCIKE